MGTPDKQLPGAHKFSWLQKLGIAGFLFFLIKGLLWLIVPALLVYLGLKQG